jgi:hypothetical protein
MMIRAFRKRIFKDESGVVLVLVALLLVVFLGVGALVIDLGVLYVARNELQNAADAGALAGARDLYLDNGLAVDPNANNVAIAAATANLSVGGTPVEVSADDVERGHWSFGLGSRPRGFYPNPSTAATILANFSEVELDEDPNFINAVRVIARRRATLVPSFFARIFNYSGFEASAEAVAYLGYAGNVDTDEIDYPIALCREAVIKQTEEGEVVDCTTGRVLSSDQTARWNNYEQPCSGAANAAEVNQLMRPCGSGNPEQIFFGQGVTTTHGVQANNVDTLRDCWLDADLLKHAVPKAKGKGSTDFPAEPWPIKLLVVDCENASPTCATVTGVVKVNVMWITNPQNASYVPMRMETPPNYKGEITWENTNPDYQARWTDFATYFNLRNEDGSLATVAPGDFTIYLHQDCEPHEPTGGTGGVNYGVMAKIPVLVR